MARVTTLTSKGQVTIPKEIRDEVDLQLHDKISFQTEHGHAEFGRLPRLAELMGCLPSLASLGLDITVEEAIDLAMEEHAVEVFERMKRQ